MRLIVEEIAQLKSHDRDRYVREIAKMFDLSQGQFWKMLIR